MKARWQPLHALGIAALLLTPDLRAGTASASDYTWGHDKALNVTDPATIQRELQDMWDCAGRSVRLDANWQTTMDAAHKIGFRSLVIIISVPPNSLPDFAQYAQVAVATARTHPDAYIELGNECNLTVFSPEQYATMAKGAYRAIKDAGLPNIVLLGAVGNSPSTVGHYSMLDWCKQLVRYGYVKGQAFDWANYHIYGDPSVAEPYLHLFTPNSAGESCQTVFGNPFFAITEFGASLSKDCGGSEAVQAKYISDWMVLFKAQPQFRLGLQYAMADQAPGPGTGYGLRRLDLSHRPAWDAYFAVASQNLPISSAEPSPPTNLRVTSPPPF